MNGSWRGHINHVVSALLVLGFAVTAYQRLNGYLVKPTFGATFSSDYASHLGLDPHQVYLAILDELQAKVIRLPVNWNEIEVVAGERQFAELDWYMNEAMKREVKVILAVGNKVPRWPECQTPVWAIGLLPEEFDQALLAHVRAVVERYSAHPALSRWQIENEQLFPFGNCPIPNNARFAKELNLVRELDPHHPIQLTVSGEQQAWVSQAWQADIIGSSLYRFAWNPTIGFSVFPIPPVWYSLQAKSVTLFTKKSVISELQAEPWFPRDVMKYDPAEAQAFFTPQLLRLHAAYAVRTGIKEISFWGVEWWYYLKEHGYPELWNEGVRIMTAKKE